MTTPIFSECEFASVNNFRPTFQQNVNKFKSLEYKHYITL